MEQHFKNALEQNKNPFLHVFENCGINLCCKNIAFFEKCAEQHPLAASVPDISIMIQDSIKSFRKEEKKDIIILARLFKKYRIQKPKSSPVNIVFSEENLSEDKIVDKITAEMDIIAEKARDIPVRSLESEWKSLPSSYENDAREWNKTISTLDLLDQRVHGQRDYSSSSNYSSSSE